MNAFQPIKQTKNNDILSLFLFYFALSQMSEGNYIMKFILDFRGLNRFRSHADVLVSLHEKFKFYTNLIKMEVRNWNQKKTRASRSFICIGNAICCFVSIVRLLCTFIWKKKCVRLHLQEKMLRTLMLSFVWNYKINRKRLTIDSKPIKSANIFFIEF